MTGFLSSGPKMSLVGLRCAGPRLTPVSLLPRGRLQCQATSQEVKDEGYYFVEIQSAAELFQAGQYQEAEQAFRALLGGMRKDLGDEHAAVWIVVINLAASLEKLHNATGQVQCLQEAAELNKEAVRLQQQGLGEEHPDVLSSKEDLARVYEKLENWAAAADVLREVVQQRRRSEGEDHPATKKATESLTRVLKKDRGNGKL